MTSNNNLNGGYTSPGGSAIVKSYTQDSPQFWKYIKGSATSASILTPTTPNAKVLINNDLTVFGNIYISGEILPISMNPVNPMNPMNQSVEQIPLLVDQIQRMQKEIDLLKSQFKLKE